LSLCSQYGEVRKLFFFRQIFKNKNINHKRKNTLYEQFDH
jgi:hypothetical protein